MSGIIHELMTFILHRLYHVSCEKSIQSIQLHVTVNVRSSIKKIILVSKCLEKKKLKNLTPPPWTHPRPLGPTSPWNF